MKPQPLPCNEIYEQLILGSMLNSQNAINSCLFSLESEDFCFAIHMAVFNEIRAFCVENSSLDFFRFIETLKSKDTLNRCGGLNFLMQIMNSGAGYCDYEGYLRELKDLSSKRKLILAAKEGFDDAFIPSKKYEEIEKELFERLFKIKGIGNDKTFVPSEVLDNFSDIGSFEAHALWMQDRVKRGLPPYTGIASGYPILDSTLGYFRDGCIYYIGARTSMGKTTFMLNLINGMLSGGKNMPIGIFSLEMPASLLVSKMLCMMSDVRFSTFEDMKISQEQFDRIMDRAKHMRKLNVLIEDEEDLTISKLRARARRLVQNSGVKIIFIDYLTRIKSDQKLSSKHLQVDEISKGLQSMAKELNIPVICLAQLNRASMNRTNSVPTLADFRESGSIEEDCDGAILIHRPDYYDPMQNPGQIQIIVAKNRLRGQLKKIAFMKQFTSELYNELEDLGEVVNKINQKEFNPFEKSSRYPDDD